MTWHWPPRVVLLSAILSARVIACSCSPAAEAPACEKIATAQVVFVGTVRAIEPDPQLPGVTNARVYRLQVMAAYKGLPPATDEVIVNPDNFTSCQTEYKQGVTYLIFGATLGETGQVMSGGCSGSRPTKYAEDDVRFLEDYKNDRASNAVYGRVLQWATSIGRPRREDDAPVAGATVVLSNDSRKHTQRTTSSGDFRFETVPAGSYELSAALEPYVANPTSVSVTVPAVGCVEVYPRLEARTSISGTLVTKDGDPAAKMRVELLRKNSSGSWYSTYQFWTQTNVDGSFRFEDLPTGDYLLGYEIWGGRPSNYPEYPTQYFPGTSDQTQAAVLHLAPMQYIDGLKLALAAPHTQRTIRVVVVWPDGSAPTRNLLQLFDGKELIRNLGGSLRGVPGPVHDGTITFSGSAERVYDLHVRYWIDDLGGPVPHDQQRIARSEVVRLQPGTGPATVRLVLNRRLMADEDR